MAVASEDAKGRTPLDIAITQAPQIFKLILSDTSLHPFFSKYSTSEGNSRSHTRCLVHNEYLFFYIHIYEVIVHFVKPKHSHTMTTHNY